MICRRSRCIGIDVGTDRECAYEEKDGHFWHLLYPVKETGEMLELATTRPETMLGDTAVAINGEDPRYAHLHGCHVILPLLNKEIPIAMLLDNTVDAFCLQHGIKRDL